MKFLARALSAGLILSAMGLFVSGGSAYAGDEPGSGLRSASEPTMVAAAVPRKWTHVPGKASDIAIGGNRVWVLGVDTIKGGSSIFRYNGRGWDNMGGSATAIAVGSDGDPWICQDNGHIYQRVANRWHPMPGRANQIASGGNQVYALGVISEAYGYDIYRWARGTWEKLDGSALSIAVDGDGMPWVCNSDNDIYRRVNNTWVKTPGKSSQLAISGNYVFAIGVDVENGGFGLHRWDGDGWEKHVCGATKVAVSDTQVWVINDEGNIFRSQL